WSGGVGRRSLLGGLPRRSSSLGGGTAPGLPPTGSGRDSSSVRLSRQDPGASLPQCQWWSRPHERPNRSARHAHPGGGASRSALEISPHTPSRRDGSARVGLSRLTTSERNSPTMARLDERRNPHRVRARVSLIDRIEYALRSRGAK